MCHTGHESMDEAARRGKNNRARGLAIERKVRDLLKKYMNTDAWRVPIRGGPAADVITDRGRCPLCLHEECDRLELAVEVKSKSEKESCASKKGRSKKSNCEGKSKRSKGNFRQCNTLSLQASKNYKIALAKRRKKMGKLLVKVGLWIQSTWIKLLCKWNWLVSKLIVNVNNCPVAECVCKK